MNKKSRGTRTQEKRRETKKKRGYSADAQLGTLRIKEKWPEGIDKYVCRNVLDDLRKVLHQF